MQLLLATTTLALCLSATALAAGAGVKQGSYSQHQATNVQPSESISASEVEYVDGPLAPLYDFLIQRRLQKFCKLLRDAGVDDYLISIGGYWTVFVPTDASFLYLPGGTLETLKNNPQQLRDFVLYHFVTGDFPSSQVQNEMLVDSVQGSILRFNTYGQMVTVSGAQIIEPDLEFELGRIHVVDHPLYPIPTGDTVAYLRTSHQRLYRLLLDAGLINYIASGPFTILAPNDDAFEFLSVELKDALAANRSLAERILLNHILPGSLYSGGIVDGMRWDTVGGSVITFTTKRGLIFANGIPIVLPDVPFNNGVIHVLNRVLLPEGVEAECNCKPSTGTPSGVQPPFVPPQRPAPNIQTPRPVQPPVSVGPRIPPQQTQRPPFSPTRTRTTLRPGSLQTQATRAPLTQPPPEEDFNTVLGPEIQPQGRPDITRTTRYPPGPSRRGPSPPTPGFVPGLPQTVSENDVAPPKEFVPVVTNVQPTRATPTRWVNRQPTQPTRRPQTTRPNNRVTPSVVAGRVPNPQQPDFGTPSPRQGVQTQRPPVGSWQQRNQVTTRPPVQPRPTTPPRVPSPTQRRPTQPRPPTGPVIPQVTEPSFESNRQTPNCRRRGERVNPSNRNLPICSDTGDQDCQNSPHNPTDPRPLCPTQSDCRGPNDPFNPSDNRPLCQPQVPGQQACRTPGERPYAGDRRPLCSSPPQTGCRDPSAPFNPSDNRPLCPVNNVTPPQEVPQSGCRRQDEPFNPADNRPLCQPQVPGQQGCRAPGERPFAGDRRPLCTSTPPPQTGCRDPSAPFNPSDNRPLCPGTSSVNNVTPPQSVPQSGCRRQDEPFNPTDNRPLCQPQVPGQQGCRAPGERPYAGDRRPLCTPTPPPQTGCRDPSAPFNPSDNRPLCPGTSSVNNVTPPQSVPQSGCRRQDEPFNPTDNRPLCQPQVPGQQGCRAPGERPYAGDRRPLCTPTPPPQTGCRDPSAPFNPSDNRPLCPGTSSVNNVTPPQSVPQSGCRRQDEPFNPSDNRPLCPISGQSCRAPGERPYAGDRRPLCTPSAPSQAGGCRDSSAPFNPSDNRPLCPTTGPINNVTPSQEVPQSGCRRQDEPFNPQDRRPICPTQPPQDCRSFNERPKPGDTRPMCTFNRQTPTRQSHVNKGQQMPIQPQNNRNSQTTRRQSWQQTTRAQAWQQTTRAQSWQPTTKPPQPPPVTSPNNQIDQGVPEAGGEQPVPPPFEPQRGTFQTRPQVSPRQPTQTGSYPSRPGSPPAPNTVQPQYPGSRPQTNLGRPQYPGSRPSQPQPDRNVGQPGPSQPGTFDQPQYPGSSPGSQPHSGTHGQPQGPSTRPQTPGTQPGQPQSPSTRPQAPGSRPVQSPGSRPAPPTQSRPQGPFNPQQPGQTPPVQPVDSGVSGRQPFVPQRRPVSPTRAPVTSYPGRVTTSPRVPVSVDGTSTPGEDTRRSLYEIVEDPALLIRGTPVKLTKIFSLFQKAGLGDILSGPGPTTVFLPADDAFAALPKGVVEQLEANPELLRQVLLYHVTSFEILPNAQGESYTTPSMEGTLIPITMLNGGRLILISGAKAIAVTRANNGIFYVINKLLYPIPHENIVSAIQSRPDLTTLSWLLSLSGLTELLQDQSPYTFLAPTDNAFAKLSPGALEELTQNTSALQELLLNHIVEGAHYGREFLTGAVYPSVRGGRLRFQIVSYGYQVNEINIKTPEIVTGTGVIHLIDDILLEETDKKFLSRFDNAEPSGNPAGIPSNEFQPFNRQPPSTGGQSTSSWQSNTATGGRNNAGAGQPNTGTGGHSTTSRHGAGGPSSTSGQTSHGTGGHSTSTGQTSHGAGGHSTSTGQTSHGAGGHISGSGQTSHGVGGRGTNSGQTSHGTGGHSTGSGQTIPGAGGFVSRRGPSQGGQTQPTGLQPAHPQGHVGVGQTGNRQTQTQGSFGQPTHGSRQPVVAGGGQRSGVKGGGGGGQQMTNVADLARSMGLNRFASWITNTGLLEKIHDGGVYTVFAPTDDAVNSLPQDMVYSIDSDPEQTKSLLQYHIIPRKLNLNSLGNDETTSTLLQGKSIRFNVYHTAQTGSQQVVTVSGTPIGDSQMSMGQVQLIPVQQVLYQPTGNLLNIIDASPILQSLSQAIKSARVTWILSGTGPLTFFAPSDTAFQSLSEEEKKSLIEDKQAFTEFLNRHLVRGTFFSSGVQEDVQKNNESNKPMTISLQNGVLTVNSVPVAYSDITATNGVLHVIDQFL